MGVLDAFWIRGWRVPLAEYIVFDRRKRPLLAPSGAKNTSISIGPNGYSHVKNVRYANYGSD